MLSRRFSGCRSHWETNLQSTVALPLSPTSVANRHLKDLKMASMLAAPSPFIYPVRVDRQTRLSPARDPDPLTVTPAETADFHLSPAPTYRLPEDKLRRLRVVHIGSGLSGLTFAMMAKWRLKQVDVQIYEKNEELGGTWLENVYPGTKKKEKGRGGR